MYVIEILKMRISLTFVVPHLVHRITILHILYAVLIVLPSDPHKTGGTLNEQVIGWPCDKQHSTLPGQSDIHYSISIQSTPNTFVISESVARIQWPVFSKGN